VGDIAEVFLEQSQMKNTGVLVRAAHNRCVEADSSYLWEYVRDQPVQFTKEVKLPETNKRVERTATLEVTYCPVSIKAPSRLKNAGSFNVYAVYAREINAPVGSEPVEWMLLTTECVKERLEHSYSSNYGKQHSRSRWMLDCSLSCKRAKGFLLVL